MKNIKKLNAGEQRLLEDVIQEKFGRISYFLEQEKEEEIKVELAIIEPSEEGDFYRIVTIGLSSYDMNGDFDNIELMIKIPSSYKVNLDKKEWQWIKEMILMICKMIYINKMNIIFGDHFDFGRKFDGKFREKITGAFLEVTYDLDFEEFYEVQTGDKKVTFLGVYPLYSDELDKIKNRNGGLIYEVLTNFLAYFPDRESYANLTEDEAEKIIWDWD